ncbi:MAG: hypothetical protein WA231_12665, partial [Methylocella sp.]
ARHPIDEMLVTAAYSSINLVHGRGTRGLVCSMDATVPSMIDQRKPDHFPDHFRGPFMIRKI